MFEQRVGTAMGDTALSGVVGVGDSDYPQGKYLYLCNSQQTCSYSKLVQRCGGEKVRLIKTFHILSMGLLTFAHRDDQGLVRKILSCCLTSKKQQVTNFNHQL